MKNKHLFWTLSTVVLLTAGTWGCKSLTENPDFASPDTFYKTEAEIQAALNGAYRPLNYEWFNSYYNRCVLDCALGISTGYEKGPQYYPTGTYVATDEYIGAYWKQLYDGVNRANVVLDAVEKIDAGAISATGKQQINAEARFLRAMYYYQLFGWFENIPVPSKPTRELGVYESNEGGKDKALALMIADLTIAENDLPATDGTGRPTKWAAKTLLAKILLEKGDNAAAKSKAEEVVTQSGITLFDNFSNVYDVANENKGERLFEIQCDFNASSGNIYNNMHAHFTPTDWDGGDPNTLSVGDGVTAAGWGDAWIIGNNKWRSDFFNDSNDKRIQVTFMDRYRSKNAGGEVVTFDPAASSAFVSVGSTERTYKNSIFQKVISYNTGGWQNQSKNFVILRYSDALLAHAEACANLGDNAGLATLNTVRQRAGLAPAAALTKDEVFAEWMREFASDGWAFPTCKRMGKTAEVIKSYTGRTVDNAKYRVFPIPAVEIIANTSLRQNPGWE